MSDDEARRMTVDEIAVMREIVRWRKANDVVLSMSWARYSRAISGWINWEGRTVDGIRSCVTFDRGTEQLGEVGDYHGGPFRWHEVESVTQAVDLLVAYGYLPARFSTAYRAGWNNAMDAERVGLGYEEPAW